MKATTINVQITKSPKQYEAVRLGMEATIDTGETVESAIKAATEQLNAIYAEMYTGGAKVAQNAGNAANTEPKQDSKAPAGKELLKFGDARVQAIVNRIEKDPSQIETILANVEKYYELDEQAKKTIELAVQLNKK